MKHMFLSMTVLSLGAAFNAERAAAQTAPAPTPTPPAETKPADPAPKKEEAAKSDTPQSLDDLLGIGKGDQPTEGGNGAEPDRPAPPPQDPGHVALERKLTAEEAANKFREAIREMGEASTRITESRDIGIVTQRLQQDIIRKLDMLVNQQNQSNSSSSSSKSKKSQEPQQQPNQPQSGQPQQSDSPAQGENKSEMVPPAAEKAQPRAVLDAARAAWGALPERVRSMLLQGSNDQFSSFYERLTEEYYRRLAEREK